MLDSARLRDLKTVGTDDSFSSLTDLNDVIVDTDKSAEERIISFAKQINNPYLFKIGEFTVKVEYGVGTSLSEALGRILNAG